jgi:hypothetical protein
MSTEPLRGERDLKPLIRSGRYALGYSRSGNRVWLRRPG